MTAYQDLIATADDEYDEGRFKDAHITYGKALATRGPRDYYCRLMRGLCSRLVAEQRLQKAIDQPGKGQQFLDQAARWLAKSEAYLDSALEEAPESQRGEIRLHQAQTEEAIGRFVVMCGGDPERRLSTARSYREEALALQA